MKKLKQFLKWFFICLGTLLVIILFFQIKLVRLYMNDYVWNVCEQKYSNGNIRSSMAEPDADSNFLGFYKLEYCAVSPHRDNSKFIVKLRDAKTNKVYKKGFSDNDTYINIDWHSREVGFGRGDGSICFYLPRKNDPNKELIEEKIGRPITDYDRSVDSGCI